ncbi:hypothetical protein BC830DRAFT_248121 [Chytriomyces sp. MP71]|nr:hypothetical protein BC830DRAFT_248121 [Chytriomyces sp. MP71]
MAVAKMAKAYRIDEVAASVVCMQCASALDDVAAKVLKKNPNNLDALYVHFFHEKIPSRTLAVNTTTEVLDTLIAHFPMTPAYYRTRAMVHAFRQDFPASLKDFKHAIALSKKNAPPASFALVSNGKSAAALSNTRRDLILKALYAQHLNPFGSLTDDTMSDPFNTNSSSHSMAGSPKKNAHVEAEKPDEVYESQLYFLRAATQHQYAVSIIETAIHKVNQQFRSPASSASGAPGSGARASMEQAIQTPSTAYMAHEVMLGKVNSYKGVFNQAKSQLVTLAKKSIKDYVYFLNHFAMTMEPFDFGLDEKPPARISAASTDSEGALVVVTRGLSFTTPRDDCIRLMKSIPRSALESRGQVYPQIMPSSSNLIDSPASSTSTLVAIPSRRGSQLSFISSADDPPILEPIPLPPGPTSIFEDPDIVKTGPAGTYHPLLLEAWFAIGLNLLILGDFARALKWHAHVLRMQAAVDGFPVFMAARCMSHSDYFELLRMVKERVCPDVWAAEEGVEGVLARRGAKVEPLMQLHTKRADALAVYMQHLIAGGK